MTITITEEERKLLLEYLKDGLAYSRSCCKVQEQNLLKKLGEEEEYIAKFIEALEKRKEELND